MRRQTHSEKGEELAAMEVRTLEEEVEESAAGGSVGLDERSVSEDEDMEGGMVAGGSDGRSRLHRNVGGYGEQCQGAALNNISTMCCAVSACWSLAVVVTSTLAALAAAAWWSLSV